MSEKKDQVDSPKEAIGDLMQNLVETKQLNARSNEEEQKSKNFKLNEKEDKEDYWVIWGQLVNDWNNQYKKNTQYVKVRLD